MKMKKKQFAVMVTAVVLLSTFGSASLIMYVLDTDHCIGLLRGKDSVLSKLKSLDDDIEIYTTTITAAELFYGAYRMPNPERRMQEVR
jgi:predicted nucleic acid-binding protein